MAVTIDGAFVLLSSSFSLFSDGVSGAPKATATSINISSAKSTVFLRHLPIRGTNLVFVLLSAYLSVIHSSALYFSVSRYVKRDFFQFHQTVAGFAGNGDLVVD